MEPLPERREEGQRVLLAAMKTSQAATQRSYRIQSEYEFCRGRVQAGDRIRGTLGDIDPVNQIPF